MSNSWLMDNISITYFFPSIKISQIKYKFTKEKRVDTPYEKVLKKYKFDVPDFIQ